MAPQRLPKKLGLNATVSSSPRFIQPVQFWKDLYPNDYCTQCSKFTVTALKTTNNGKHQLKLLLPDHPNNTFHALAHNVRLEKAGPPNQYFLNDACPPPAAGVAINVNVAQDAEDEDREPVEDGALEDNGEFMSGEEGTADDNSDDLNGPSSDGNWSWTGFMDGIMTDARGSTE